MEYGLLLELQNLCQGGSVCMFPFRRRQNTHRKLSFCVRAHNKSYISSSEAGGSAVFVLPSRLPLGSFAVPFKFQFDVAILNNCTQTQFPAQSLSGPRLVGGNSAVKQPVTGVVERGGKKNTAQQFLGGLLSTESGNLFHE